MNVNGKRCGGSMPTFGDTRSEAGKRDEFSAWRCLSVSTGVSNGLRTKTIPNSRNFVSTLLVNFLGPNISDSSVSPLVLWSQD